MIPSNHAASRYGFSPTPASLRAQILKRCTVGMRNKLTGQLEFELIIYGRSAADLLTVPNDVIGSLAERYPDHQSTIFDVDDWMPSSYRLSPPPAPEPSWEMRLAAHLEAMSSVTNALRKHRKTK